MVPKSTECFYCLLLAIISDSSISNTILSPQVSSGQSSLLGDPPKEVRLPSNPYLNLASVMPGVVLQGKPVVGKVKHVNPLV